MTHTSGSSINERRNKLINKLIAFNIYKKGEKHLYELSLFELEQEYKKFSANCHPHGEISSIQWNRNN